MQLMWHKEEINIIISCFAVIRIGFATAKRLAAEGASIVVSSRKQENVDAAVRVLKDYGYNVAGVVCHVTKAEDRQQLFQVVSIM